MRRIGVLMTFAESDTVAQARLSALVRGLHEFGWTEGRNLRIEFRGIDEVDTDRLRAYATELVGMAPDVLLAGGAAPLLALQRATQTIPIVFAVVPDPVANGFVTSVARPGGNVTGFATYEQTISVK